MSDPVSHGQMMNYLVRNSEDKKRMREYFETNQITTASNINRPREPKLTQIFQDFNERNPLADGGRIGFKKPGMVKKKTTVLTPKMVIDIAEKNKELSASQILEKLQQSKTKKYVSRDGAPINRAVIQKTLSETFDLTAERKSKVPKGYISSAELFEQLPIQKKDYFRVKMPTSQSKGAGTTLTRKIDELLEPIRITTGGTSQLYFKKPTKKQIDLFNLISTRKGILRKPTINLMQSLHETFGKDFYDKGQLPTLKQIREQISPDITASSAGNATARLSQWYNGTNFLNEELKNLKRSKSRATKIFAATEKSEFTNSFYKDEAYKIALDTIDEKIGRQVGSFKAFKDNIKVALKEAGLPIYSKNSKFGFNLNEIAGVTGAARTKTAAFSDFVDIMEGNFNQKQLAVFQKKFAKVREDLDGLDLANNPQKRSQAQDIINTFQDTIKYYEKETGAKLPNLGLGSADLYYKQDTLADIAKERMVGETGKKKFRKIPGTDLLKASKDAGYTVIVPENYRTVGQIMETGQRGVLKQNVQNTIEGMKKFFNEYDETKMFEKLKNATPDTLRRMMRVIPRVASLDEDIQKLRFASADNIMTDATVVDDQTFAEKNPITTGTALTGAGTAGVLKAAGIPIKQAAGKVFRTLGTGAGVLPFAGLTVKDNLAQGENIIDATLDPVVGAELLAPRLFPEIVSKITKNPTLQRALTLGKFGRALTPVGAGITAAGLAIDYGKFVRDELRRKAEDPEAYRAEQQEQMGISAAGGGLAKQAGDRSGAMLRSMNPDSQGLSGLLKRANKI